MLFKVDANFSGVAILDVDMYFFIAVLMMTSASFACFTLATANASNNRNE